MPIIIPGKRFSPRLQNSRLFGKGAHARKGTFADLLITPLVDMFIIIVIFLLQSFSATGEILFMSKDITLPDAANGADIDRSPVVQVSQEVILLEGEQIALVSDLERDTYWNIPALEEKLRDLKRKYEQLHTGGASGEFKGDVNIQAHKDVAFKTLKRVMYSCSQATYTNLNYATMATGGPPTVSEKK